MAQVIMQCDLALVTALAEYVPQDGPSNGGGVWSTPDTDPVKLHRNTYFDEKMASWKIPPLPAEPSATGFTTPYWPSDGSAGTFTQLGPLHIYTADPIYQCDTNKLLRIAIPLHTRSPFAPFSAPVPGGWAVFLLDFGAQDWDNLEVSFDLDEWSLQIAPDVSLAFADIVAALTDDSTGTAGQWKTQAAEARVVLSLMKLLATDRRFRNSKKKGVVPNKFGGIGLAMLSADIPTSLDAVDKWAAQFWQDQRIDIRATLLGLGAVSSNWPLPLLPVSVVSVAPTKALNVVMFRADVSNRVSTIQPNFGPGLGSVGLAIGLQYVNTMPGESVQQLAGGIGTICVERGGTSEPAPGGAGSIFTPNGTPPLVFQANIPAVWAQFNKSAESTPAAPPLDKMIEVTGPDVAWPPEGLLELLAETFKLAAEDLPVIDFSVLSKRGREFAGAIAAEGGGVTLPNGFRLEGGSLDHPGNVLTVESDASLQAAIGLPFHSGPIAARWNQVTFAFSPAAFDPVLDNLFCGISIPQISQPVVEGDFETVWPFPTVHVVVFVDSMSVNRVGSGLELKDGGDSPPFGSKLIFVLAVSFNITGTIDGHQFSVPACTGGIEVSLVPKSGGQAKMVSALCVLSADSKARIAKAAADAKFGQAKWFNDTIFFRVPPEVERQIPAINLTDLMRPIVERLWSDDTGLLLMGTGRRTILQQVGDILTANSSLGGFLVHPPNLANPVIAQWEWAGRTPVVEAGQVVADLGHIIWTGQTNLPPRSPCPLAPSPQLGFDLKVEAVESFDLTNAFGVKVGTLTPACRCFVQPIQLYVGHALLFGWLTSVPRTVAGVPTEGGMISGLPGGMALPYTVSIVEGDLFAVPPSLPEAGPFPVTKMSLTSGEYLKLLEQPPSKSRIAWGRSNVPEDTLALPQPIAFFAVGPDAEPAAAANRSVLQVQIVPNFVYDVQPPVIPTGWFSNLGLAEQFVDGKRTYSISNPMLFPVPSDPAGVPLHSLTKSVTVRVEFECSPNDWLDQVRQSLMVAASAGATEAKDLLATLTGLKGLELSGEKVVVERSFAFEIIKVVS